MEKTYLVDVDVLVRRGVTVTAHDADEAHYKVQQLIKDGYLDWHEGVAFSDSEEIVGITEVD